MNAKLQKYLADPVAAIGVLEVMLAEAVEQTADRSPEYVERLEALQGIIAYAAHRSSTSYDLRVVGVAIRAENGLVYSRMRPYRHHHLIQCMKDNGYVGKLTGAQQGFLLSDGRFCGRKPARDIAAVAGQILRGGKLIGSVLTSEDLW